MQLYKISDEYQQALEAYQLAEDDQSQQEALANISKVEGKLDAKIEACLAYLKNLEAETDAISNEIKRLQARKKTSEAKAESFRSYLQTCVESLGKWSNGVFTISFRNYKSVVIDNEELIDPCYKKEVWKIEIDKKELEAALRTGAIVTGAFLEDKKSMVIR
ncbi:siphovirus Gp157 family protein [Candidatus Dependentiae bacterium]|nr:MAG: siphovirus Gp157 family protein [Candidatus Dependentiae bacterium]